MGTCCDLLRKTNEYPCAACCTSRSTPMLVCTEMLPVIAFHPLPNAQPALSRQFHPNSTPFPLTSILAHPTPYLPPPSRFMLNRLSKRLLHTTKLSITRRLAASAYRPVIFRTMATQLSDADIVSRLEKLSIASPEVLQHAPVKGGQEWKAELEKAGKGAVAVTKTVSVG